MRKKHEHATERNGERVIRHIRRIIAAKQCKYRARRPAGGAGKPRYVVKRAVYAKLQREKDVCADRGENDEVKREKPCLTQP